MYIFSVTLQYTSKFDMAFIFYVLVQIRYTKPPLLPKNISRIQTAQANGNAGYRYLYYV